MSAFVFLKRSSIFHELQIVQNYSNHCFKSYQNWPVLTRINYFVRVYFMKFNQMWVTFLKPHAWCGLSETNFPTLMLDLLLPNAADMLLDINSWFDMLLTAFDNMYWFHLWDKNEEHSNCLDETFGLFIFGAIDEFVSSNNVHVLAPPP